MASVTDSQLANYIWASESIKSISTAKNDKNHTVHLIPQIRTSCTKDTSPKDKHGLNRCQISAAPRVLFGPWDQVAPADPRNCTGSPAFAGAFWTLLSPGIACKGMLLAVPGSEENSSSKGFNFND